MPAFVGVQECAFRVALCHWPCVLCKNAWAATQHVNTCIQRNIAWLRKGIEWSWRGLEKWLVQTEKEMTEWKCV